MKGEGESGAVLEAFLSLPSLSFFFLLLLKFTLRLDSVRPQAVLNFSLQGNFVYLPVA